MKFNIYIKGRAWSFQLAESLNKRNNLNYLITSYPKFYTNKYGIPNNKVKSFFIIELFQKIFLKISYYLNKFFNISLYIYTINICDLISDYIHSLFINKSSNIYILGFGNSTCRILKELKKKNIPSIYFLNNCSDNFFDKILEEENAKFGIKNHTVNTFVRKRVNKSIQESDYIGAISSFQAKTYIDDGIIDGSRILINPLGVNTKLFKPNPKHNNKFIVSCVANDVIRKGLVYLIEAYNSLSLENAELWLIGSFDKNLLNKITNLKANIKIIGLVNEFKLANYYNESSVFCLPTLEDGGPMVIPQAMSCGIPVISSKYCIAPDLITSGQEGYIIDPRNTKEIAEKIKFLYDNPNERSLMGKMARKKIEEIGSWDNVSERLIDFFNKKLKLK